jgi:hypothetical protein
LSKALIDYLDGTDVKVVAAAARELDRQALLAGQISPEDYKRNMEKSDKTLLLERNRYRNQELKRG